MKNVLVLLIAFLMALPGFLFLIPSEDVKADNVFSAGNDLFVDDSGGSTYTTIYAALQDAADGDTIYVAPGIYSLASGFDLINVQIRGNFSQGEVRITGSVEFIPMYFSRCTNITVTGFYLLGSGTTVEMRDSKDITFGFNTFDSTTTSIYDTVVMRDSEDISFALCSFISTGHDNFAFYSTNTDNVTVDSVTVTMGDTNAGILQAVNSDNAVLRAISGTYSGDLVDAQGSSVTTLNMDVPNGDATIDGTSSLLVKWERRVLVSEEDNTTRLGGVDMELMIEGSPAYRTAYYRGWDDTSNANGNFPMLPPLIQKMFSGSSSPTYLSNNMRFYYDGLDVPREVDLGMVAADNTDWIYVIFPDMRQPEPPVNVTANTIDQDTIEIGFDASPSDDVVRYEIYHKGPGWKEIMNSTDPGDFDIDELEPATLHQFRVRAVDDAGLNSQWVDVENTTGPAVEGTIAGTVMYVGGPLNGTAVFNASVLCYNDHSNGTWTGTTNLTGVFELLNVDFEDDFHLLVVPPDAVEDGSMMTGYINTTFDFDFHEDLNLDLNVAYYEYVPPVMGSLSGMITYLDGPMEGANATNANVFLFNDTMVDLGNYTVNETGMYLFEGVHFGTNYTMWIIPENDVGWNGTESGYVKEVITFDFLGDTVKDFALSYYEYTPPTGGDIHGRVTFDGGPKGGEGVSDVQVVLLNSTGKLVRMVVSNSTGHYRFENVPFGTGFSIKVIPKDDDIGEVDVSTGYLPATSAAFDHLSGEKEMDVSLEYYEYVPSEEHPSVTILDEDGNPVPDVVVIVTINGTKHTAVTDENGVATFNDLSGTGFPEGSSFKAMKEGYDDIEWTEEEAVPDMVKEKEKKGSDLFLVVIIVLAVIMIAVIAYLFLRRGASSGERFPEE